MKKAPIPQNEAQRLAALYALKILDTPPEERFDRVTRLATRLFDVPIAQVSLVDADREWFKSCQGLSITESPRDISFCGHAILSPDTFVVPDTLLDERFADNPMVTGEPKLRFYAGQPLAAPDGSRIGMLCLKDHRPRQLAQEDLQTLRDLAAMVESELSLVEVNALQHKLADANQALEQEITAHQQAQTALQAAHTELEQRVEERTIELAKTNAVLLEQMAGREQTELALQEAQTRYRTLVEQMPAAIYIWELGEGGRCRYISPQIEPMFGFTVAEWLADPELFYKQVHPDDQARVIAAEELARETNEPLYSEFRMLTRAGRVIWVRDQSVVLPDETGQPKLNQGILLDITVQKQAEQTITHQNELLDKIINNLPVGVFAKDVQNDYRFIIWNAKMAEILGVQSEAMLGKNDYDFSEKKLADQYHQLDIAVMEKGQLVDVPVEEIVTAQEVHRLAHTIKLPLFDRQGNPQLLLGILEDITERKQSEEALRQANRVVENSPVVLFRWSADEAAGWPVEYVSQNVAQFGYTAEEFMSGAVAYADLTHPDDLEKNEREVKDYTARGIDRYFQEYRIITRDGRVRWVQDHTVIERDSQGQALYYQGIMLDVTEHKVTEAERERLLAEIEATYRQYIRQEWEQYLTGRQDKWQVAHQIGELLPTAGLERLAQLEAAALAEGKTKAVAGVKNNGHSTEASLVAPLSLRGQVIGALSLQDINPDRQWTAEEIALVETVSEQLALTVENLRLFDDTQKRATREQLTRQIIDKMRSASDIDTIVQTGLTELAKALNLSRAYVKLTTQPEVEHS